MKSNILKNSKSVFEDISRRIDKSNKILEKIINENMCVIDNDRIFDTKEDYETFRKQYILSFKEESFNKLQLYIVEKMINEFEMLFSEYKIKCEINTDFIFEDLLKTYNITMKLELNDEEIEILRIKPFTKTLIVIFEKESTYLKADLTSIQKRITAIEENIEKLNICLKKPWIYASETNQISKVVFKKDKIKEEIKKELDAAYDNLSYEKINLKEYSNLLSNLEIQENLVYKDLNAIKNILCEKFNFTEDN